MPTSKTYSAGASAERTAILAKIRRMGRDVRLIDPSELIEWILKRDERYNKRKGGLGK